MLDDKVIERIKKLVPRLLNEGLIKKNSEYRKLSNFFIENAQDSLNSAKLLFEVSTNEKLMEITGFKTTIFHLSWISGLVALPHIIWNLLCSKTTLVEYWVSKTITYICVNQKHATHLWLVVFDKFKGYLWTINASYYSMYYMANALLASEGIKIAAETGVHKIAFDAFTYYFYLTDKITRQYVEEFLEAQNDSDELLGKDEFIREADAKARKLIMDLAYESRKRKTFTYELERARIEAKAKTSIERAQNFLTEIMKILSGKNK